MNVNANHNYPDIGFWIEEVRPHVFVLQWDTAMLKQDEALSLAQVRGYEFTYDEAIGIVCTNMQAMDDAVEVKHPHIPERKTFIITVEVNRHLMPTADIASAVKDALRNGCISTIGIAELPQEEEETDNDNGQL